MLGDARCSDNNIFRWSCTSIFNNKGLDGGGKEVDSALWRRVPEQMLPVFHRNVLTSFSVSLLYPEDGGNTSFWNIVPVNHGTCELGSNRYVVPSIVKIHSNYYFIIIIIISSSSSSSINVVSCHRPFLPGTSLEPAVIPTAQASSFTLQYFPYYVW
jgi:hypothetical protein